jgi:DNA-cytosine methyltransferase
LPKFQAVGAVDWDAVATKTYEMNFPGTPVVKADLSALDLGAIRELLRRFGVRTGQLDVLIAGPPCQSYSRNNRSSQPDDERSWLYLPVIDWVKMARPKAILVENVDQLRASNGGFHDQTIRALLSDLNYVVDAWDLDAVDFGIPQHRTRRFYLAFRGDLDVLPTLPPPSHHPTGGLLQPWWVSAAEAIDDLPPLASSGDGSEEFTTRADPDSDTFRRRNSAYAGLMRADKGVKVAHHWTPRLSELALSRLRMLLAGAAIEALPKSLQPRMGVRSAYGRIHPDRPAWTITANCDYPSRGRFSHYSLNRGLSMREVARLQSFPDEFRFFGFRESVARQIGNAVPPLLARAFATAIATAITGEAEAGLADQSPTAFGPLVAAAS